MIEHAKEYGVYHWDTFDYETIMIFEDNDLEVCEEFVRERYKGRIKPTGADQVDIVTRRGNIVRKYNVG